MKLISYIFLLALIFAGRAQGFGQNRLDENGKKTGYWTVSYPNGNTRYESEFVTGKPVGLMKRYYENGILYAEMMFKSDEDRCYANLYHMNGKPAAEGWYSGQKKDSVWTYYSEYGEHIILREPYTMGSIVGVVESYYQNGQVAEQTNWIDNRKHGPWLIFFDDGGQRLRGSYVEGSREGKYETFYSDSTLELSGFYRNNVADGEWTLYNEDGSLNFVFKYQDGELLNRSDLLDGPDEILTRLQELADPENIIDE